MRNKNVMSLIAAGILLLVCTLTFAEKPTEEPQYRETHTHSGFLGNYENFKVLNKQTEAEVWIKPPHEDFKILNSYNSIVFSPIQVWLDPATEYKGIDPNELKVITDYFLQSLQSELGKNYQIVDKPGPGVMNFRIAITGVAQKKPDYMKVINLLPVKLIWEVGNAAYRKVTAQTIDVFEAQAELEIVDSQTGDRLVAVIDKHQLKDTRKQDEEANWDTMQEILDYWAKTISDRLSAARK